MDGAFLALEKPDIAIFSDVDETLDGFPVAFVIDQDRRGYFIPVKCLVRHILVVTADFACSYIDGDGRAGIQVVARAFISHPRAAVAGSPESQLGFRIVVPGDPGRTAAAFPLLATHWPAVTSRFTRGRNRKCSPHLLA